MLRWSFSPREIFLRGEIACRGGIVVTVGKTMTVKEDLVQTVAYAYNAHLRGHGNILRHDNAHARPGHPDDHHRHTLDPWAEEELPGSSEWVGEAGWPLRLGAGPRLQASDPQHRQ